ncbi:MAG: VanW family protein [Clostridia bacterium]|nr:VanW family protein [Clostridia bacterium]
MKRERKREKKTSKNRVWIIIASIMGAIIILAGGAFAALNPGSRIARGVHIEGINVGGKTVEKAKELITPEKSFEGQEFTLKDSVSGAETSFSADVVSLTYDIDKTTQEAYKIGRGEGLIADAANLVRLVFSPIDIPYSFGYDKEGLQKILYDFGVSVNGEQMNYALEFGEGIVKVKRGASGQDKDVEDLENAFFEAIKKGENIVTLTLETKEAPVSTAESLYDEIYIEPKDAAYEIANGKMTVTPEVLGREIDKNEAIEQIEKIKNGGEAVLKLITLEPKVTEASINADLFGTVLGKFSTSYATSSKNRSDNVELAARKIDGIILMPNEEFSYNGVVGKRTAANGFKEAPVFENGETVQGMGGGVCQVSSTLYSAVLYSDLPVLERKSHSLTVSYVPKGQDATVAYGSIDFRFKNDTKGPIKISAKTGGKTIEMAIWGAKPEKEKKVEIINSVVETKSPSVEEVADPTLKSGDRKVISNGKTGYTVATTRKVFVDGKEVKSEKMTASKYKMVPTKVAVGSAAVPAFDETLDNSEKTETDTEKKEEEEAETEEKTEKTENTEKPVIERPSANETVKEEE